jgi:hypothetical protein
MFSIGYIIWKNCQKKKPSSLIYLSKNSHSNNFDNYINSSQWLKLYFRDFNKGFMISNQQTVIEQPRRFKKLFYYQEILQELDQVPTPKHPGTIIVTGKCQAILTSKILWSFIQDL